jgi:hypothetical protein
MQNSLGGALLCSVKAGLDEEEEENNGGNILDLLK